MNLFGKFFSGDSPFLRRYQDGQVILPQGYVLPALGVVQKGEVEVFQKTVDGEERILAVLAPQQCFGIHSLFEEAPRPSGVRACGPTEILLLDKIEFLRCIHQNPELAFVILQQASQRINQLTMELKDKSNPAPLPESARAIF
ncbi:MAG: cyclic nucleotide-binding domain-containing protein [Magnetococcales bacterium]|nr:cyclic nucleotide-binding domain-containing protein [Magnetococcales bacterium]NGZ26282.1 cyclic nucleotide-binding domain-containing protein [Magnetococcales bacterium]